MTQRDYIIDDATREELLFYPFVDGERKHHGYIERDYTRYPVEYLSPPSEMPLIPRSEWSERIKEAEENKSRLSDMRGQMPSLDQGQVGYCAPPETLITMADGSNKPIAEIAAGDTVMSAEGNRREVKECYRREHVGEMVRLQAGDEFAVRLTPNHEVRTTQGYRPSGKLKPGDGIFVLDGNSLRVLPVQKVQRHRYAGMVHNFAVDGDQSYIAGKIGVHNCWAHSTTHCVMLTRLRDGMPYIPLSAYAVAATIVQGRDEGGWCGLSAKFIRERGIPAQSIWPQGSRDYRKYDKPETWQNAALHKSLEDWVDLSRQVHDQNLTFDMVASCLLCGIPCALDFNWWGHSVCGMDLVEVERDSYGIRILNSWSDKWGERGTSVLQGDRAIPNGAVAIRTSVASFASHYNPPRMAA